MSLTVSNRQIAQEPDLTISDVQKMTEQLRQAVHDKGPDVTWLRPHRGIWQENLPLYLGFFECLHNIRRRGKAALSGLKESKVRLPKETIIDNLAIHFSTFF